MGKRNASPTAFGWDFQCNAAILLMLENIKDADKVRVEGADEDIEITLSDSTKIYSQVKSVNRLDDYANVNTKLEEALETLNDACSNGNGSLFTYIINSPNPFNNIKTMSYFTGKTHLYYDELPETAKKKISKIIAEKNYEKFDTKKFDIRVIPFYGKDPKNRYKEIQATVNSCLVDIGVTDNGISSEILEIWQRDFFHNATIVNTEVEIEKKEMIWPLIVLVVDRAGANEYKRDFNDDECEEIEEKYKFVINQKTMMYDFMTKIITDHRISKLSIKEFVNKNWQNYLGALQEVQAENEIKESLAKIIIYKILTKRQYISSIKKDVNL